MDWHCLLGDDESDWPAIYQCGRTLPWTMGVAKTAISWRDALESTITLSQALTSRSPGSWSSSIGAIAHPCSRNSTHVEMREAPLQSFASSDPAQMTAVYINIYTSRSKAPFTLRQMFLIHLLISIRYLCLGTMWCGFKNRYQKKDMCLKEIGLHVQNILTNLSSLVNIIKGDLYDHFVSSKKMRKVTPAFIWIC